MPNQVFGRADFDILIINSLMYFHKLVSTRVRLRRKTSIAGYTTAAMSIVKTLSDSFLSVLIVRLNKNGRIDTRVAMG